MEWPLERGDGCRHRSVEIGQRRGGHPRREGRGIELVLGVEDQRDVQHARHRLRLLVPVPVCQQIEQVLGKAPVRAGLHLALRVRQAMRVGDEDGDLGQEADGLAEVGVPRGIGCIWIGHPQQRHAGSQDIHRMRARRDDADESLHGTGQRPLRPQLRGEVAQLFTRGQLAEQQ